MEWDYAGEKVLRTTVQNKTKINTTKIGTVSLI